MGERREFFRLVWTSKHGEREEGSWCTDHGLIIRAASLFSSLRGERHHVGWESGFPLSPLEELAAVQAELPAPVVHRVPPVDLLIREEVNRALNGEVLAYAYAPSSEGLQHGGRFAVLWRRQTGSLTDHGAHSGRISYYACKWRTSLFRGVYRDELAEAKHAYQQKVLRL
tara:strand:+ start:750 stop:1259 length:510 start_codon:yes stop_codon:yes gene_type:complete